MIDINKVTDRTILRLKNSLNTYDYIQRHYQDDNEDFKDVYTDFYLSAKASMRKKENRIPYFNLLNEKSSNKDYNLIGIVKELKDKLELNDYEFSFATKLLHTINTDMPIYDSKVYTYLKSEGVDLWDIQYERKGTNKLTRIEHNWESLCLWYDGMLGSTKGTEWIIWFDSTFPEYKHISNVKKIDFIIYAWS